MNTKTLFRILAFLLLISLLFPLWAQEQEIKLLVNQAGYDTSGIKQVWLQSELFLGDLTVFQVVQGNEVVYTGNWEQDIKLWGHWYKFGDFSDLSATGEFRIRAQREGQTFESPSFIIESSRLIHWTGPLAVRFFTIQRCGIEVPGWHEACHLDDAKMPDGSYRDLIGGWHDAGDYNKYNGYTPLAVYALAKFAGKSAVQGMEWPEKWPTPLEEALWGATWLRKAQDPQTKKISERVFSGYAYWGPPELETDNIPGTADDRPLFILGWNENEMSVAAYAALYANTGDLRWKNAALELWDVVAVQGPVSGVLQRAKRLLAAVELYKITSSSQVLRDAEQSASYLARNQNWDGGWRKWSSAIVNFGMPAAALAEFILTVPRNDVTEEARNALIRYTQYWDQLRLQPFDVLKWSETEQFYPHSPNEWYVGQNGMYLSQAWAGALLARILPLQRNQILKWTQSCIDWIVGANPFGICMMYGAGSHHLPQYHHKYESIPNGKNGKVPGAICNGITRESPDSDVPFLDLIGHIWQTNEPWLPHNAFFLLTLNHLGEDPLEEEKKKKGTQRR